MLDAIVVSSWVLQNGTYTPKLLVDYPLPAGGRYMDLVGQPRFMPSPNLNLVSITVTEEYLNAAEISGYAVITEEEETKVTTI